MATRDAARLCMLVLMATSAGCAGTPASRVPYEPRSFLGYACRGDCEDHKQGFAWAAARGVAEVAGCAVLEDAAAEGCRAWVEERHSPVQAGLRWARENEVQQPNRCSGAGPAFAAGCRSYVGAGIGTLGASDGDAVPGGRQAR
jgi:hypothetical protein